MHKRPFSLTAMTEHVERVCREAGIHLDTRWVERPGDAYAVRATDGAGAVDEVQTPPIRSAITYATALHEIGHILGPNQDSPNSHTRERWAWQWARENALVWTGAMERYATRALKQPGRSGS
jgi:hypothetical protein